MATSRWSRILFRNKNKAQNEGRKYFKVFFFFAQGTQNESMMWGPRLTAGSYA